MTLRSTKCLKNAFKQQRLKAVAVMLVVSVLLSLLAACGSSNTTTKKYIKPQSGLSLESCEVARNEKYALSWDDEAKSIQVECLETGKIWSNISYDKFKDGSTSVYANSSMSINVVDTTLLVSDTVTSYGAYLDGGDIIAKRIDNGVRVTYFFDVQKIAIPVEYVLNDDSLSVSVDTAKIREGDESCALTSFSTAAMLCSSANDNDNGYLFVPSGQGALMQTNVTPDGARAWNGEVYGDDVSMLRTEQFTNEKAVRLPVFGAKDGENAVFGIIESAAGNSVISASAGNPKSGRSAVCAEFFVRGHDSYWKGSQIYGQSILTQYAKQIDKYVATVRYYFLNGDDADYNGMAKLYKNYLINNGKLVKSALENKPYALSYLGGTTINKSALGIPTTELVALTTFEEAQSSLKGISNSAGVAPYVRLLNYGDEGLSPGTYLGGEKIDSVYGDSTQLNNLISTIKENGTELFFDFDLIYFGKGGNGVSKSGDTAKTAVKYPSVKYDVSPIRIYDEDSEYYVVTRGKFDTGVEKMLKKADKYGLKALSIASFTNSLYSDYGFENTSKSSMENQVLAILAQVKKNKLIASSEANAYSAGISDVIFDVPCEDDNSIYFNDTVPFYQMVFSGYVPMYSQSINFAVNAEQALATAASSGIGIGFTLTGRYVSQSNDYDTYKLYATPSGYNEEKIQNILVNKGFIDYFNKIGNASVERYNIGSNGVSLTVFSNGVRVYTNHSGKSCDSPVGTLAAYEFRIEGAKQ